MTGTNLPEWLALLEPLYPNDSLIQIIPNNDSKIIKSNFHPISEEFWTLVKGDSIHYFEVYDLSLGDKKKIKINDNKFNDVLNGKIVENNHLSFSLDGQLVFFSEYIDEIKINKGDVYIPDKLYETYSYNLRTGEVYIKNGDIISLVDSSYKLNLQNNILYQKGKIKKEFDDVLKIDKRGRHFIVKISDDYSILSYKGNTIINDLTIPDDLIILDYNVEREFIVGLQEENSDRYIAIYDFDNSLLARIIHKDISNHRRNDIRSYIKDEYVYFYVDYWNYSKSNILRCDISNIRSKIDSASKFVLNQQNNELIFSFKDSVFYLDLVRNSRNAFYLPNFNERLQQSKNDLYSFHTSAIYLFNSYYKSLDTIDFHLKKHFKYSYFDKYNKFFITKLFKPAKNKKDKIGIDIIGYDFKGKKMFSFYRNEKALNIVVKSNNDSTFHISTKDSIVYYSIVGKYIGGFKKPRQFIFELNEDSYMIRDSIGQHYQVFTTMGRNPHFFLTNENSYLTFDRLNNSITEINISGDIVHQTFLELLKFELDVNYILSYRNGFTFFYDYKSILEIDKNGYCQNRIHFGKNVWKDDISIFGKKVFYMDDGNLYSIELKPQYAIKDNILIQKLSLDFKIDNGVLEIDDIIKSKDKVLMLEAVDYFLRKNSKSEKLKLEDMDNLLIIISNLNFKGFNYRDVGEVFSNNPVYIEKYLCGVKSIIHDIPKTEKKNIPIMSSSLTDKLLREQNFSLALKASEFIDILDHKNNRIFNTLALAFLLNNKWSKASSIYLKYQDSLYYGERKCKQVFLEDLDEMEKLGITHPDFQKVRELLGATEEKPEETTTNDQ